MSTALAVVESQPISTFSSEQVDLIRKTIAPGLTEGELAVFVEVCKRSRLDPFRKQIYAIARGQGHDRRVTHQTSIDGFRILAERTGKYRGQLGPFWCGDDGVWKDVWLSSKAPSACRVGVMRSDFSEPLWGTARLASFGGQGLWAKMPDHMLAKVAEALALRRAFPEDLSGLYTSEEMDQAAPESPAQAAPASPAPALARQPRQRKAPEQAPVPAAPTIPVTTSEGVVQVEAPARVVRELVTPPAPVTIDGVRALIAASVDKPTLLASMKALEALKAQRIGTIPEQNAVTQEWLEKKAQVLGGAK